MADVIYAVDAGQWASLLSTLATNGTTIATAIGDVNINLTSINTQLEQLNTKLTNIETSLQTYLGNLKDTLNQNSVTTNQSLQTLRDAIAAKIEEFKTELTSVSIPATNGKLTEIKTVLEKLDILQSICNQISVDITDPSLLHKDIGDATGEKGIAYLLASQLELIIESKDEAEKAEAGGSTETPPSSEEISVIDTAISNSINAALASIPLFSYGVIEDIRLTFQSEADFEQSKLGLAFDFSRRFVNKFEVPENATITEYAILASENTVRTSSADDTSMDKIRSWRDYKIIQTIVVIENSLSKTAQLYYPAEALIGELVTGTFISKKKAFDYAMSQYQTDLDEKYLAYSFIPVTSIEQGCYTEEYRERAKLITAEIEYN